MDTFLGLLELVGWMLLVLAFSAVTTYAMAKLTARLRRRVSADDGATAEPGS